jgi:hypothetical protein
LLRRTTTPPRKPPACDGSDSPPRPPQTTIRSGTSVAESLKRHRPGGQRSAPGSKSCTTRTSCASAQLNLGCTSTTPRCGHGSTASTATHSAKAPCCPLAPASPDWSGRTAPRSTPASCSSASRTPNTTDHRPRNGYSSGSQLTVRRTRLPPGGARRGPGRRTCRNPADHRAPDRQRRDHQRRRDGLATAADARTPLHLFGSNSAAPRCPRTTSLG